MFEATWRGRPLSVSPHAVLRWMERVEGLEFGILRRLAASTTLGSTGTDKMVVRMMELGLGMDLDVIRGRIVESLHSGTYVDRRTNFNVVTETGHLICVVRDHKADWSVATVLSPDMGTERRIPYETPSRTAAESEGDRAPEDAEDTTNR